MLEPMAAPRHRAERTAEGPPERPADQRAPETHMRWTPFPNASLPVMPGIVEAGGCSLVQQPADPRRADARAGEKRHAEAALFDRHPPGGGRRERSGRLGDELPAQEQIP